MDFHSLFRKFLYGNAGLRNDPFDDKSNDVVFHGIFEDLDPHKSNDDAVFYDSFKDLDTHINMFQQTDDMFNKISSFGMIGFPKFKENLSPHLSPRNIMIKDPDVEMCDPPPCKEKFRGFGLSMYDESGKELMRKPFSYSKFSAIKTVHLPDGIIEEHLTVIDNDGNKSTTVRRTIGDTSHEVIIESDKQGRKGKEENLINMDENEFSNFEQKWNKLKHGDTIDPSTSSISLPKSSPSYLYLLKKFFGPFQKDDVK